MTGRDRIVLIVIVVAAVLGAGWMLVVSPARQEATKIKGEVTSAQSELSTAEGQLSSARAAEAAYPTAYASVVSLGKAVPASEEVPSLIYQLSQATNEKSVEFASISSGSGAGSATSTAATSASTGFSPMPFTFIFNGGFFQLEQLFHNIDGFANRDAAGGVEASGRLLTIQSVKLAPSASTGKGGTTALAGTISATAYRLPASQSVTAGATAASPAGASTPASATPASSAAPATATVKVNP